MIYNYKIEYPKNVGYIIEKLNDNGFEAFMVGGCVRDSLLGRTPYDWDVTTNALPQDVKKIFYKTYDTGIKHGTVSVVVEDAIIEVTTYRVDGEYSDNRRPKQVSYTTSLEEDLARRDFTINALAYNPKIGLVDPFEGLKDINGKIIRAVGNSGDRFLEDALRMLRAVRFSAQLGFTIEAETYCAIHENSVLIRNISKERVRDELNKILTSLYPSKFNHLYKTGLLQYIIPDFIPCYKTEQNNPYHVYNVAEHIIHTVESVEADKILRWTMLLHDIGKPPRKTTDEKGIDHFYGHPQVSADMAERILNDLRLDKATIRKIVTLIKYHDIDLFDTERSIRRVANKVGEHLFLQLVEVQRADAMGQNPEYLEERLIKTDNIKLIYDKVKNDNHCLSIEQMALKGNDLIAMGMKPGKDLGRILSILFDAVLENPELNNKEKLMELVLNCYKKNAD